MVVGWGWVVVGFTGLGLWVTGFVVGRVVVVFGVVWVVVLLAMGVIGLVLVGCVVSFGLVGGFGLVGCCCTWLLVVLLGFCGARVLGGGGG